ncbi:MAG: transposase [Defluviitaleaceae bacterium]|nr:transposase [Defluviitaleaceae bacterium]
MDYRSRKSNRIPEYDYSQAGAYFVTICSHNRKHIFGKIAVGAGIARPHLSPIGKIIENSINQISEKYPHVSVDCYVIMPNHVHLLLSIHDASAGGRAMHAPTVSRAIQQMKGYVTKLVGATTGRPSDTPIWQKGFHEHVVRDERDYLRIWQYIENNSYNWHDDEYYPQWYLEVLLWKNHKQQP